MPLTEAQLNSLAPDASALKSAQSLAKPTAWVTLGRGAAVVWGECQGSGKLPYRTQMDVEQLAA